MKLEIAKYLDVTYLKTADELSTSNKENKKNVLNVILQAIEMSAACIMIRPEYVQLAREQVLEHKSSVVIGTVVDFPFGNSSTNEKVSQALVAINNGATDIDFVCDYNSFKMGSFDKFDADVLSGTEIVISHKKTVKWIIETGALSKKEIRAITLRIHTLLSPIYFKNLKDIFIKTSTGYYGGSGANIKDIKTIKSVCGNLSVKASGGVSDLKSSLEMIEAGVTRIGTSKAQNIYNESLNNEL